MQPNEHTEHHAPRVGPQTPPERQITPHTPPQSDPQTTHGKTDNSTENPTGDSKIRTHKQQALHSVSQQMCTKRKHTRQARTMQAGALLHTTASALQLSSRWINVCTRLGYLFRQRDLHMSIWVSPSSSNFCSVGRFAIWEMRWNICVCACVSLCMSPQALAQSLLQGWGSEWERGKARKGEGEWTRGTKMRGQENMKER